MQFSVIVFLWTVVELISLQQSRGVFTLQPTNQPYIMIEVTQKIKEEIANIIKDGEKDGQSILITLIECEVIDKEYPQLYRADGTFDVSLDNIIQDAVIAEIEEQLK